MRENVNMSMIKQLVQDDQYRVDPYAVADAIVRRMTVHQNSCSKPDSGSSQSTKHTPGSPSTTDPIQFRPALG